MAQSRSTFLDELIRHEGRGSYMGDVVCYKCKGNAGTYRCNDCFGRELYCRACVVQNHASVPMHQIKQWNGTFFEAVTLKVLGLRVQLGHGPGQRCINPTRTESFTVVDSGGIHEIGLDFCGCETAQTRVKQLLRARMFPATVRDPRTAATFGVLEQFHLLSLESKVSAYEFYHALKRRSDNTGLCEPKDRYKAFLRMIREWRHLKMMKRSGRGSVPDGIVMTKPGECAILCPACPQPGMNLPLDWMSANPAQSWLYRAFLAIDANFRLKRKNVSSNSTDPSLGDGWAYFVEDGPYKEYLKTRTGKRQERSTCSGHTAVNLADTKATHGLAVTGLGTIDCARHGFKLPQGVGNLQKGEKYINMDYFFCSAMKTYRELPMLFVSYDIACQWSKNLWEWMSRMPPSLQIDHERKSFEFGVPKFHLPAHREPCQVRYSMNLLPFVGRTDGKGPEQGWANINPIASSTKEMGPGSRQDTLDDFFGDWNWKKTVGMRNNLLTKMKEAVNEKAEQAMMHHDYQAALDCNAIAQWSKMVESWETDHKQTNPYERQGEVLTQAKVRLELAMDEAQELQNGNDVSIHTDISPSDLISTGIYLEEHQCRLAIDMATTGSGRTDLQEARLQLCTNLLQRRIESWASAQILYMPLVARQHVKDQENQANQAEPPVKSRPDTYKLYLPSEHPSIASTSLQRIEWRFRYAQAFDALKDMRQLLRLRAYLVEFKRLNIRGQGANTRAQNTLKGISAKIQITVARYRRAHDALTVLGRVLGKVGWDTMLRKLKEEDIRALNVGTDGQTEGRRTISWIWQGMRTSSNVNNEDSELQESLRIEWCKSRARVNRWTEEVSLLIEEMRHVLVFFAQKAKFWQEHSAYSARQASLYNALRIACKVDWLGLDRVEGKNCPDRSEGTPRCT
ncbi:hypothetical protein EV363DRAFT_1169765 [Boletus edulis]|nr:hypothetical protein EV363DRAFT_1169765 [Boletus edulis]